MSRGSPINLIGKRFSRLVVVGIFERTKSGKLWMCLCDCGNEVIKLTSQLTRQKLSIGCFECSPERRSENTALRTHGECKFGQTRLYKLWKSMNSRCSNLKDKSYGAKGVRVCEEWKWFPNFREWALGSGYRDDVITNGKNQLTTIERIDTNGNYEPSNCEWISASENTRRALVKRWQ